MATKTFQEMKQACEAAMYDRYVVQFRTENRLLGGWPKNPIEELALLKARRNQNLIKEETYAAAVAAVQEASSDDPGEETEQTKLRAWTGFPSDDDGIFLASRQLKSAMKESASVLGLMADVRGSKQILQHSFFTYGLQHRDQVRFYRTPFTVDDQARERVVMPDGYEQLIAHVIGPQGPRSTIKFHDYVENVYFEYELLVRDYKSRVTLEKFITPILVHMQSNGLGCSRSQGYGRLEILDCEQLGKAVVKTREEKVPAGKTSNGKKRSKGEQVVQDVAVVEN